MEAILANTWSERSFYFTPVIAYNSKDKELLLAFIVFAVIINFKNKQL
jgi:hypothetical protein